ncbi:MAG: carboxypeptidase regulatory-like domain-containing protein, partial [Candidatus Hermodarchaeota archaeon]|nr:carboxypeptidase regulatory-like domain-containing protein [Candidatus Hermodarchaeota archaeon]
DEGVLVYLVNEKMPESPGMEYQGWNMFILALLNPAGNEKRDNLNQAALDSGEEMIVDFRTLYSHADLPIKVKIAVQERGSDYAKVRIEREYLLEHSISVMANPSSIRSEEASTIIVRVKEGSSYLSGAAVNLTSEKGGSFSPANGVTDVNGEFTATFVAPSVVEETSFMIKAGVKKNGYLLGQAETEVKVTPICSLLITVLDESGTPIGEVVVISKSQPAGQSKLDGITSSNGSVTFLDVTGGSYSFQASKSGYIEETASFNAKTGETNEMIITLKAEPSASEEKPPRRKGTPGFPYESIILGLVVGVSVLWMLQRRR